MAVKGTQNITNNMSAAAKLIIRRLVVERICWLAVTTVIREMCTEVCGFVCVCVYTKCLLLRSLLFRLYDVLLVLYMRCSIYIELKIFCSKIMITCRTVIVKIGGCDSKQLNEWLWYKEVVQYVSFSALRRGSERIRRNKKRNWPQNAPQNVNVSIHVRSYEVTVV